PVWEGFFIFKPLCFITGKQSLFFYWYVFRAVLKKLKRTPPYFKNFTKSEKTRKFSCRSGKLPLPIPWFLLIPATRPQNLLSTTPITVWENLILPPTAPVIPNMSLLVVVALWSLNLPITGL